MGSKMNWRRSVAIFPPFWRYFQHHRQPFSRRGREPENALPPTGANVSRTHTHTRWVFARGFFPRAKAGLLTSHLQTQQADCFCRPQPTGPSVMNSVWKEGDFFFYSDLFISFRFKSCKTNEMWSYRLNQGVGLDWNPCSNDDWCVWKVGFEEGWTIFRNVCYWIK